MFIVVVAAVVGGGGVSIETISDMGKPEIKISACNYRDVQRCIIAKRHNAETTGYLNSIGVKHSRDSVFFCSFFFLKSFHTLSIIAAQIQNLIFVR